MAMEIGVLCKTRSFSDKLSDYQHLKTYSRPPSRQNLVHLNIVLIHNVSVTTIPEWSKLKNKSSFNRTQISTFSRKCSRYMRS
jgi:hypothetical protein